LQLSAYKGASGIQALMKSNARKLAEQDELMLIASGIPYTVIRAGLLESTPGGGQGFSFEEVLLFFFYNGQDQISLRCSVSQYSNHKMFGKEIN
jgi:hypothetical protein